MNQVTTVGLDLAKHIFQLHGADSAGAVVFRKKLRRSVSAFPAQNCRPEQWRDKTQVEPSWAGKKPSEMTNEELDAAYLAFQPLLPFPETVKLRTPPRNRASCPLYELAN